TYLGKLRTGAAIDPLLAELSPAQNSLPPAGPGIAETRVKRTACLPREPGSTRRAMLAVLRGFRPGDRTPEINPLPRRSSCEISQRRPRSVHVAQLPGRYRAFAGSESPHQS